MDAVPQYSLFHMRILEELDSKCGTVSYQHLCESLCARFDLLHLTTLRSLLFYTACVDPAFPATLFKDRMRGSGEDQQSKKLMVAADIVTLFNLIQVKGGIAKDKLSVDQIRKFYKKQSCRSDAEGYQFNHNDRTHNLLDTRSHHASRNTHYLKSDCNNCQKFIPTSDPNVLLGVTKDVKCRTASLNKLQLLPQYPSIRPECEMQSTYFPMDTDGESTVDQDSVTVSPGMKNVFVSSGEPFTGYSCAQKRDIFKENVHNLVAFSPHVITAKSSPTSKAGGDNRRRELHKPPMFFNHSFEFPHSNPSFQPISSLNKMRVKHESLDDLQASTYFGPTTVSECVSAGRTSSRHEKHAAWPVKSFSLNTEEAPDMQTSFFNGKVTKNCQHDNITDNDEQFQYAEEKPTASPSGFSKTSSGTKTKDMANTCGPGVEKREVEKRYKDMSVNCLTFQQGNVDNCMSIGTQTEQSEHRTAKDHSKYRERKLFKHSDEDSEVVSDDISDIFRFLDDMSVCDSVGVVQSSCYNSIDSLSQVTKSDGDTSPEYNTIKLGKTGIKLDQLFQSLENSDDELKQSVYKLLLRTVEIEKKLESLSGVRGEISQVLSKLNKLDEKIQEPEPNGKTTDNTFEQIKTEMNLSPHVFQCHSTEHNMKVEKSPDRCCSEADGRESLEVRALKKSMFTHRSSRPLENSTTESKVSSITNSPRDWRTVSYSSHTGQEDKVRDRPSEGQDRHRKPRETDQQHDAHHSCSQLPPQVEQVFSSHHCPPAGRSYVKGNQVYTDLRLTSQTDGKCSQPSWTTEEYKHNSGDKNKLSAVGLQVQESLNPNDLESWIEGVYTPAYNSLLKHREAEFRRAKTCRMGALIAAAACTVLLVIIVPICTMSS